MCSVCPMWDEFHTYLLNLRHGSEHDICFKHFARFGFAKLSSVRVHQIKSVNQWFVPFLIFAVLVLQESHDRLSWDEGHMGNKNAPAATEAVAVVSNDKKRFRKPENATDPWPCEQVQRVSCVRLFIYVLHARCSQYKRFICRLGRVVADFIVRCGMALSVSLLFLSCPPLHCSLCFFRLCFLVPPRFLNSEAAVP